MATIRSLLNPISANDPEAEEKARLQRLSKDLARLATPTFDRDCASLLPSRKKQKICKDAAVFKRSPVRGECRYPPHEFQDDKLETYHKQFEVYPIGEIAQYPRHIPYNSEKKNFLEKTGREYLEVFQYQFKVPGEETTFTMLWDYNIGLVRTTPLFKCCGYSKTTPAKMLNRNPGLREICHSITGGALVAQGYWMPFEAAKAVAASFCWSIRYALTPVFGLDFPDLCITPDSDRFGEMLIDSKITQKCTEQAKIYREIEGYQSSRASSTLPSPSTPETPIYPRHIKPLKKKTNYKIAIQNSDYSTDAGHEENYTLSSERSPIFHRTTWSAINSPRSVPRLDVRPPPLPLLRKPIFSNMTNKFNRKRVAFSSSSSSDSSSASSSSEDSSSAISPKTTTRMDLDKAYEGDGSDDSTSENESPLIITNTDTINNTKATTTSPLLSDEKAAYLLMSLKMNNNSSGVNETSQINRKRRASA